MNLKWAMPLMLSLAVMGCGNRENEATTAVRQVPVIAVSTKTVTLPSEYVAQVRAVQNVEIRARVQGYLDNIRVDEGAFVEKNQVLFSINDEEYKNQYEQALSAYHSAAAEARIAELEVSRMKLMVEKNVISQTELDLSKMKLMSLKAKAEEADASRKHAEIRLSHTRIRAPFAGIIDRIPYKSGSLIREGEMLTTVSNTTDVFAYFNVSEKEYLRLRSNGARNGQRTVNLILADGSLYPEQGVIETMAGEFDTNTGSIAFRARFKNSNGLLRHGATATVVIEQKENDALLVPRKSTFEIQDKTFVFAVGNDNKVSMKSISPKASLDEVYVVQSGLKPGERVVYEGIQFLKEGMVIQPKTLKTDSLLTYQYQPSRRYVQ